MPSVIDYTALLYINDVANAVWNNYTTLGTPVIVTYSFADGVNVPTVGGSANSVTGTSAFTTAQRQNFRDVTNIYQAAAGITFVEVAEGGMVDLSNATGSAYGGWADIPWTSSGFTSNGILVIDSNGNYNPGSYGFLTLLHELGHSMGLQHPHDGSVTLNPFWDNQDTTVMTYNNSVPYTSVLGTFDLQALTHLYGPARDTSGWTITYNEVTSVLNVQADAGKDVLLGVRGDNHLSGGSGGDTLMGREGQDSLYGQKGNDHLFGESGDDSLNGGAGRDLLYGGAGADSIKGGGGADTLYGDWSSDYLLGNNGNDYIDGGVLNDTIKGGNGDDNLIGNTGWDTIFGGAGNDTLTGDAGFDQFFDGRDRLFGGAGKDSLFGGGDNDSLTGGRGNDILTGGTGWDVFYFDDKSRKDHITDFGLGGDYIDLSASSYVFTDLTFLVRNGGADTLVDVGAGSFTIYLEGVALADIGQFDFLF